MKWGTATMRYQLGRFIAFLRRALRRPEPASHAVEGPPEIFEQDTRHVLPIGDSDDHVCWRFCRCNPFLDEDEFGVIVVHNSFDGRELSATEFFHSELLH